MDDSVAGMRCYNLKVGYYSVKYALQPEDGKINNKVIVYYTKFIVGNGFGYLKLEENNKNMVTGSNISIKLIHFNR